MGAVVVSLAVERALRELGELCERRPDIGAALDAAAGGNVIELDFLTVDESAHALRVQPQTIRAWVRQGRLPMYRAGRRVLLRRADVAALVVPVQPGELLDDDDDDTAP